MKLIVSNNFNPYFNIASEEYLLKNFSDNIIFIYRNTQAIIVGKHQNVFAEINNAFVHENQIPVIRRISGGGTVFHDQGNINFSFIFKGEPSKLVDFNKYTQPIVEFLQLKNIDAQIGKRNNIYIKNNKISGNAEHVYKNIVLHHGTLLYNTNLQTLTQCLHQSENYTGKAVKSVTANVTNITNYLTNPSSVSQFQTELVQFLSARLNAELFTLSETDLKNIEQLIIQKYQLWSWNYGYSPAFLFEKSLLLNNQPLHIKLHVKNGIIVEANLQSNSQNKNQLNNLEALLLNKNYDYYTIYLLVKQNIGFINGHFTEIMKLFF